MGERSKLQGKAEIMSKNEIITELYNSKEFRETISKMHPVQLQEDLRSEVMLILCEKDEEEIISIYNSGGLKYYTVRIILNLIQSNTSPFYKKFRSLDHLGVSDYTGGIEGSLEDMITSGGYRSSERDTKAIALIHRDITDEEDFYRQLKECSALDEIENLYWYDREIIKIYLRLGTYRAVELETGIPWESVYKTIRKGCQKIKLKVA